MAHKTQIKPNKLSLVIIWSQMLDEIFPIHIDT